MPPRVTKKAHTRVALPEDDDALIRRIKSLEARIATLDDRLVELEASIALEKDRV